MGDIIFGDAETDNPTIKKVAESLHQELPRKKGDGVREKDVRWWWNLNDIERRLMLKMDELHRTALFLDELQKSTEPSKEKAASRAAEKVKRFHPLYGDPDDTAHTKDGDRPLFVELKNRINIYLEKRAKEDPDKFAAQIKKSTSFNALVRREIRNGKL